MMFVEAKWLRNDCLNFAKSNDDSIFNYEYPKKNGIIKVKVKDKFQERQLQYLGSQMIQSVLDEMKSNIKTLSSLKKRGKKVGSLKFCSEAKSINLKQYGNTYKFKSFHKMKLQGVSGKIPINGFQQFDLDQCDFANAKILNTPKGYYVAITVFKEKTKESKQYLDEIGVDFGCKDNLTTSENQKFNCYVEETERLKKLQRKLAKQKKNSNNYNKTRLKIRQQYQKITNKKNDQANKVVYELLKHEKVYIQDEQLAAWQANWHGKAVNHSFMGNVKQKLSRSQRVVIIKKFVPTTKKCYCGYVWDKLKLNDRTLKCPQCGIEEDRDLHAAKMIVIQGQIQTNLKVRKELAEFTPVDLSFKKNENEAGSCQPLGWQ